MDAEQILVCDSLPSKRLGSAGLILVTGASGYIGGRLVRELLGRGYRVRVMVRGGLVQQRAAWPDCEVVVADALQPQTLRAALLNVETAYYLIHSLHLGPNKFSQADTEAAMNFRRTAEECGVRRIIYLGGLGDARVQLSPHLRSRMEVAEELRRGTVPVTVLRAAIIIGSGSASYEIVKHLTLNLPVILMPRWAKNRCHPICVRDVLKYLVGVLESPETAGHNFDIGGRDVLSYHEMVRTMAEVHRKKRLFVPLPCSFVRPLAYLANLATPVPLALTRCLFAGLKNEVICENDSITQLLPFERLSYRQAIILAMTREEQDRVHTRWTNSYPPAHELAIRLSELALPPTYSVSYSLMTAKPGESLFQSIMKIGGREGWFNSNWMWWLRGGVDRLLGGVGSARGRRSETTLKAGDVIDFWRVEELQPQQRLLLRAEMKLPGRAWLEFLIKPGGRCNELSVSAYYDTKSIWGKIYWYAFRPFHTFIFKDLIRQIERRS